MPARFWVYIGSNVQGPVEIPALRKLEGFNLLTQVCAEGEQAWRMADEVIEIKSYFLSPPRPMPLPFDTGNTAPLIETLPEPAVETLKMEKPVELKVIEPAGEKGKAAAVPGGLRVSCETCGYKNPRDVPGCMKCGTPLKGPKEEVELAPPKTDLSFLVKPPTMQEPPSNVVVVTKPPHVEIPVARIAVITAILSAVTASGIVGHHFWMKKHKPVRAKVAVAAVHAKPAASAVQSTRRPVRGMAHTPVARRTPALQATPSSSEPRADSYTESDSDSSSTRPAGYRVLPQATALKRRESSEIDSPYASSRRSDTRLWTQKEEQAIRIAQKQRVYGGLRTIQRNTDILMQILRDREYMAGFETGKRPYLYNQAQWAASPKEGPVYEVRMTFLGGKDANGDATKPLKFAFDVDLERGTVRPGGDDAVRANAMHAFFDEGRIPPEDRRSIAKDVEQLVLAAQPGGSPLALDTVLRNFVETYSGNSAQRVADAFKLDLVQKRLRHDPQLVGEVKPPAVMAAISAAQVPGMTQVASQVAPPAAQAKTKKASTVTEAATLQPKPVAVVTPSAGASPIDFRMERAEGRGRTLQVRLTSRASPARLWEVLTSYDRYKQFVPDMLLSDREGQDGRATIVHTQSLVRVMIFVFKLELHLRILEHPERHLLEFEKIAGEFESFRGAVEITTDPTTQQSVVQFRASLVPKGRTMNWTLRDGARKFLVPLFAAIRAQAEAN